MLFISFTLSAQQFQFSNSNQELSLTYKGNPFIIKTKTVDNKEYIDFSDVTKIEMLLKDAPALPVFSESLQIDNSGSYQIEVNYGDYQEFDNVSVLPSKGSLKRNINPSSIAYKEGVAYEQNDFFPGSLATLGNPYIFRKTRGITVSFYPYQYNPVTKKLRVYNTITAKLIKNQNDGIGVNERIASQQENDAIFQNYYKNHYANALAYTPIEEEGELLIISPNEFTATIQPLINWKNEKGIKTTLVTKEQAGSTPEEIKEYITSFYSSNPNLIFVLLVGDSDKMPVYSYGITGALEELYSDSYYGMIEGDDMYPELFVGRLSGNATQIQTMVSRVLEYETNPLTGNWMTNAIGIGSNEGNGYGDDGEADFVHLRNIREKLQNFGYNTVYEFYQGSQGGADANGEPTPNMIINALNQGTGLMNYTGHGWTEGISTSDFTISNVNQLTNAGKYPFVVSVACNNGTFVNDTSICEAFTCVKNGNSITGAIASCGSSILMAWAEPMQTQDEMTELIIQSDASNEKYTLGGLFYNGQISMLEAYNQSITAEEVMQTWVLFGDPSTVFRSKTATTILATHPENFSINGGQLTITSNSQNGFVSITHNNQILATGYLNNGTITLTIPSFSIEHNLKVTISKPNTVPYRGEIIPVTLGLADFNANFIIYPNPTRDNLIINTTSLEYQNVLATVYDVNGRKVAEKKLENTTQNTISLSDLATGLYVLQLNNEAFSIQKKIVKE